MGKFVDIYKKMYRGGYSLPWTFWVFLVGGCFFFNVLVTLLETFTLLVISEENAFSGFLSLLLLPIFLILWLAWLFSASVGVFKAGKTYKGPAFWSVLARTWAILSVILSIVTILIAILVLEAFM